MNAFQKYGHLLSDFLVQPQDQNSHVPKSGLPSEEPYCSIREPFSFVNALYSELLEGWSYSSLFPTPCHSYFWEYKKCSINIC